MQLFLNKRSINLETGEKKLGRFVSEMVEHTKPPHLRQYCFEKPLDGIFGPGTELYVDPQDLRNLDLTMSRAVSVQKSMSGPDSEHPAEYLYRDDEMFPVIPEENDVVEIVKERLNRLKKAYEPEEVVEGVGDVLISYRTSPTDETLLLLRAHSQMLSKYCNAFEALLESDMRDLSLREYIDRQFMLTRKFDESSVSTEYEAETSLGRCHLQHPAKPVVAQKTVAEAFIAFREARNKALLPPPSELPVFVSDEQILQEKIIQSAADIVKRSHRLVDELQNLELPQELRGQFEKFIEIVKQCIPDTSDTKVPEYESEGEEMSLEPYQRMVRISFADCTPSGCGRSSERDSVMNPHRRTLSKWNSPTHAALQDDTLENSEEVVQASEAESIHMKGISPEEHRPHTLFDANLKRGSLLQGSLRKGSKLHESLLHGNITGSQIDTSGEESDPILGKAEELVEERTHEERTFFADFIDTLPSTPSETEFAVEPPKPPPTYSLKKTGWTASGVHAVMEFIYTERCHIPCADLPQVFQVANELLLTDVTEAITKIPLVSCLRAALMSEANRIALLELCTLADSAERQDLRTLKKMCESFEYGSCSERLPYTFTLHTGYIVGRMCEFLEEGFFEHDLVKVNVLRIPQPTMKEFDRMVEEAQHFVITKAHPEWVGGKARIDIFTLKPHNINMRETRNRDKGWFITVFGPNIAEECYNFYKQIQNWTHKPMQLETFSIRMCMGFLLCPMMQTSIAKSFPKEVKVEEVRGGGYFIGGEIHGNSLILSGKPQHLLSAAKAIPPNFMGRTSFRVCFPSKPTFIKIFSVAQKFGVDLEMNCLYLLKNLTNIIRALEYFINVSDEAFIPWDVPREIMELVAPSDPF